MARWGLRIIFDSELIERGAALSAQCIRARSTRIEAVAISRKTATLPLPCTQPWKHMPTTSILNHWPTNTCRTHARSTRANGAFQAVAIGAGYRRKRASVTASNILQAALVEARMDFSLVYSLEPDFPFRLLHAGIVGHQNR